MTEILREAAVIIPHHHRNGGPGDIIRKGLLKDAARIFGGFTETSAFGGWLDSQGRLIEERVSVVTLAAPDTVPGNALVQAFAARVAHDLDQDEVYCRYTDGEVILIKREEWHAIYEANGTAAAPLVFDRPLRDGVSVTEGEEQF